MTEDWQYRCDRDCRIFPECQLHHPWGLHQRESPPIFQKLTRQKFQSAIRTRKATHYKTKYLAADGKTQFFDVRLSPVIQDGEVVSVVSSSNNVTEYEVENLAKLALHKLAATFSALSGEEFFYQVTKCLAETLDMSHAFVGIIEAGTDRVEVIGGSVVGQPARLPMAYDLAGTPCEHVFGQSFCIHPSGVAESFPDDVLLADSIAAEIQRGYSEAALRKSKALLSDAGRMAKVGGWELDPEANKISWTEESYRIHEVPLDHDPALLGSVGYCHVDDRPVLEAAQQRALECGEPYDIEFRMVTVVSQARTSGTRTGLTFRWVVVDIWMSSLRRTARWRSTRL